MSFCVAFERRSLTRAMFSSHRQFPSHMWLAAGRPNRAPRGESKLPVQFFMPMPRQSGNTPEVGIRTLQLARVESPMWPMNTPGQPRDGELAEFRITLVGPMHVVT